jgi:hypothetical protein
VAAQYTSHLSCGLSSTDSLRPGERSAQ